MSTYLSDYVSMLAFLYFSKEPSSGGDIRDTQTSECDLYSLKNRSAGYSFRSAGIHGEALLVEFFQNGDSFYN